ncbi:MAG: hypothetical protein K2X00_20855 [Nitrospiraceae bacterium]|nr:hypothetical protein [Nitrospiraceae bacterium]
MSAPKYLIDTNVFIGLEDNAEVAPNSALLQSLATKHGVTIYVHAAAIDDIERDRDPKRRAVSLSKIAKFPIIEKVIGLKVAELESTYGKLAKPNDIVDATLLHALQIGVVDFLVTEDQALHARATRASASLGARLLYVADAVSLLRTTYEGIEVFLPAIREVDAHTIALEDPIFTSLRADYPGFDDWWRQKCVRAMRKCWIVLDGTEIAGLVVRKDELPAATDATLPGEKILKISTFKVRAENRGVKLGELLLKQILWFAQSNRYDVVYITAFEKQATLLALLEYYGFHHTSTNTNGEKIYEKIISRSRLDPGSGQSLFDIARMNYPRFATGDKVPAYAIPIVSEFHEVLFPELAQRSQLTLFNDVGFRTPGNTIRKVYLCRSPAHLTKPGALVFFYKGKSALAPSQAITTVGVFEGMALAYSTEDLRRLAGGRSVYSDVNLVAMSASQQRPVKVINFLLAGHIDPPIHLNLLKREGVFKGHPPQSITRLGPEKVKAVLAHANLGFDV